MVSLSVNGELRCFDVVPTVIALLGQLGLAGKRVAVELNGEIVPRSRHAAQALAEGDRLEIVVAVGGG
jgi:sulfur carrier protein